MANMLTCTGIHLFIYNDYVGDREFLKTNSRSDFVYACHLRSRLQARSAAYRDRSTWTVRSKWNKVGGARMQIQRSEYKVNANPVKRSDTKPVCQQLISCMSSNTQDPQSGVSAVIWWAVPSSCRQ